MVKFTIRIGIQVNNVYSKYIEKIDKLIDAIIKEFEPAETWEGLERNAVAVSKDVVVTVSNTWEYRGYQNMGPGVWFIEYVNVTIYAFEERVLIQYVERLLKKLREIAPSFAIYDVAVVGGD